MIRELKIFQSQEQMDISNYWIIYGYNDFLLTEDLENISFSCLFNKNYQVEENPLEYLNYQKIYLFTQDEDRNLWEESNNLFNFILFVSSNYETIKDEKFKIYKTLDTYESVLVYSTNDYSEGIKTIKSFLKKQENPIVNTYTLICTSSKILFKDENNFINKSIASLHFRFKVSGKNFDLLNLKNALQKSLNIKQNDIKVIELLGSHDYEIIMNVSNNELTDFQILKNLYGKQELLSFKSFSNYCINNCSMKLSGVSDENYPIEIDKSEKKKFQMYNDIFDLNNLTIEQKGIITKISRSLEAIVKFGYGDLIYRCLDEFWEKFLNELHSRKNYEELDNFLEKILDLIMISDSSQLKFYSQNLYFNNTTYAHLKLLCFYNVLIKKIKQISEENEYVFGIIPTSTNAVKVNIVFYEEQNDDRLFLVEISTKHFYNPSVLVYYIVHEVGHYIFNDIRSREQRFLFMKNSLYNLVYARIIESLDFNEEVCKIFQIEKAFKSIFEIRWSIAYNEVYEKYGENHLFLRQLIHFYSEVIKKIINTRKNFIDDLFEFVCKDNSNEVYDFFRENSEIVNNNFSNLDKIITNLNDICKMWSECFSDMIAIEVLGINLNKYLECMKKSYDEEEDCYFEYNFIRLYMMYRIFNNQDSSMFSDEDIELKKRFLWYKEHVDNLEGLSNEETALKLFIHKSQFEECEKYLKYCKNIFDKTLLNKYQDIRKLYKEINNYETLNKNYELLGLIIDVISN